MSDETKKSDRMVDGTSKVERYKWKPLTEKPDLRWIDKSKIDVDHSYQRELNDKKAVEIASTFSWPAFGALVVAERGDGKFVVTDGQHRLGAVKRRADIKEVPCVVFRAEDVVEEAHAFNDGNTLRRPLTAFDRFRAKLMLGDEAAHTVQKLVTSINRIVARGGGQGGSSKVVSCIGVLQRLAKIDTARLTKLWPLIAQLSEGGLISEILVESLFYIEGRVDGDGSLLDTKWKNRLLGIGGHELIQGAYRAAAFYARGGNRVWAAGMLEVLNSGLRNRLVLRVSTTTENSETEQ